MAKRSGGRPSHPVAGTNRTSESDTSPMIIPNVESSDSSQQSADQHAHQWPSIHMDIDIDDGNDQYSIQSMSAAPMPRHRDRRTQRLDQVSSSDSMRSMSSSERSVSFRNFNRGSGG